MRARDRDASHGAGAEAGLEGGFVGIGDALPTPPETLRDAIDGAARTHGNKAARMLARFAELPDGTFVWTRDSSDLYHLGRLAGPWRYEDPDHTNNAPGICHVRPADWLPRAFTEDDVPAAVAETFARGGRNLQRIDDADAERRTAALWP
jgi:predicted Mrr-cat superfamily restriction endonuclease